jgi:plasmid maintenance system antidote protein VapI
MSKQKTRPDKESPVSQALREAIHDQGLTAYAAAKQAGVSVDAVQRFLNEQRGLSLTTVDKLAAAMHLTLCPDDYST